MKFDTILENKNRGSMDWTIPNGRELSGSFQFYVAGGGVHKGSTLRLMGATNKSTIQTCFLRIFRLGWYSGSGARKMYHSDRFPVNPGVIWNKKSNDNPELFQNGPSWPCLFELEIPQDWCDGLYVVKIEDGNGLASLAPFWLTNPEEAEGVTVCFSPLNIQARNWWGGASSTQVVNGKSMASKTLYHQVGTDTLSLNRPMYNARAGDVLRWAYPLVRFLERHDIPITYITDLDVERLGSIPASCSHIVTVGPMRYWTKTLDSELERFCSIANKSYIHLGSEAGQHIIDVDLVGGKIHFHGKTAFERLENPLTGARPSGSKPHPPWGNMVLDDGEGQKSILQGIVGSSWDKSFDGRRAIAQGKGRHKLFRKTLAETTLRNSQGRVFNAGVSNWTWALSAFGRQGNILVNDDVQRLTLRLLDQDISILNSDLDSDMILDDEEVSSKPLEKLEQILKREPNDFNALLYSGIRLFEQGQFSIAQPRFIRAHSLQPRSILATYRLARNYHKLGNYEPMVPLYHELLRQRPNRFHYVQQYAALLLSLGETEQGLNAMKEAISIRPFDPAPYVSLGYHARLNRDYQLAKRHLNCALKIDPKHQGALAGMASLADVIGDFKTSTQYWNKILELHQNNERAMMGLAKSLYRNEKYDEAYGKLRNIIELGIERYIREAGNYSINIACNHLKDDSAIVEICSILLNQHLELLKQGKNGHVPVTQCSLALSRLGRTKEALNNLTLHEELYSNSSEFNLVKAQIYLDNENTQAYFESVKMSFSVVGNECFDSIDPQKRLLVDSMIATELTPSDGPLISVIMTVYKRNTLLESAINSVLNQSYQNLELIIIDDSSPDDVFEDLQLIATKDDRIRLHRMDVNGGTYVAKNHGMGMAKGKYIAFHDSDDWLHPRKIAASIDVLEGDESLVAVFSNYFRVDEKGDIVFRGIGAVRPACISLTMRKNPVLEEIGFFDSVRVSADSEYEYRLLAVFGEHRIKYLYEPYLIASVRSESLSQGGKFAVGWSGLSGLRLEYRQAYTKWHGSDGFEQNHYMPKKRGATRNFNAPEEMIW
jgi:tetratricopeptide (TPR) repeat protein